ncbi:MAG TPA: VWA domain-containing protein, partial [Candidatus Limnocylindria bacterium]|nr:VWA domain-containing protein [Candidatus Limnocylindria bacterium]
MSLGLLNPAGAFAFTALGVLVALYLLGRRRRVIPVPALFLWQRIPARSLEPRRFRLDPLFLAQLVLLLALIGGYLRPYVEAPTQAGERARLLVVLDVSASMQAREPEGRRFDLARRRARALVAQCLPGDEVMLVAAAERPHVILRWTTDHARARERLEVLEPVDTPGDLGPALELALGEQRARAGTQVAVFTDLPPAASGVASERLATVDYVQIGRTDDNVAIAGLTVEQPPFHPARDATATVLVRNYAHAARRVRLEAWVGTALWVRRELTIAPRGLEHVLLVDPPGTGELVVTATTGDALPLDDRAFAYLGPSEPLDILLVTASPELAGAFRGLAAAVAGSR